MGLALVAFAMITLSTALWWVMENLIWRPYIIAKGLRAQGLDGPDYKLWSGNLNEIKSLKKEARERIMEINSHDFTPRIQPQYHKWLSRYGGTFLYWFGPQPRIFISDPEMVKQVLSNKFGFYTKNKVKPVILALLGKGLILTEGADWARHRRVVSPAFTMDKLKVMTKQMAECTRSMIEGWAIKAVCREAVEVNREFVELTADVISLTAFGQSFAEGKEVFLAQRELQMLAIASVLTIDIPGYEYLLTRRNLRRWELDKQIKNGLTRIINGRMNSKGSSYGDDLLGLMMESCRDRTGAMRGGTEMSISEIIDECKTFFFAGHETTSYLLTWAVFLLSTNREWQERLREEVARECEDQIPDAEMLTKMRLTNMFLLETLRLYSPVIVMFRRADTDIKLGTLTIPKGINLTIPIAIIHRSKEVWGPDAGEFDPMRFENGINRAAKHPNALLSFSMGPRACVGQNFAMLEAKTVIAMILQKFSLSLSGEYKHAPIDMLTLQPQFGLQIVLEPLRV